VNELRDLETIVNKYEINLESLTKHAELCIDMSRSTFIIDLIYFLFFTEENTS